MSTQVGIFLFLEKKTYVRPTTFDLLIIEFHISFIIFFIKLSCSHLIFDLFSNKIVKIFSEYLDGIFL
jgi:hypothetical protein